MSQQPSPLSWKQRLLILFFKAVIAFIVFSFVCVGLMRWVPPLTSAFMLHYGVDQYLQHEKWPKIEYDWVDQTQISGHMMVAVIASEDQNFPNHRGFDLKAIEKAIKDNLDNSRQIRGASTITQQVAKNLFLVPTKSLIRKAVEAWFTLVIETCWSKQRIVEVYLNIAEFGPGIYGVEAASKHFFNKPAKDLSASQAALLAATLPNPKKYLADKPSAYVQQRQRWIQRQMNNLGGVSYLKKL